MAITKGNQYYNQAATETQSSYDAQLAALKNQLASNQQANQAQIGGVNANFDQQVQQQNIANTRSQNNISNNALGRGLSRSSIVTSGLAESDQINNRQVGYINNARTGALNDIANQGRVLEENYNNSVAALDAGRESEIMKLARQLEDTDWNRSFQNKQYDLQVRAQAAQEKYQQAQIGLQRAANAAQASYWNRQMQLAEREFELAQAEASKAKEMSYNDRNQALANMMEVYNSDLPEDRKIEALRAMGMSGDSYIDKLAKDYEKRSTTIDAVSGANYNAVNPNPNHGKNQMYTGTLGSVNNVLGMFSKPIVNSSMDLSNQLSNFFNKNKKQFKQSLLESEQMPIR